MAKDVVAFEDLFKKLFIDTTSISLRSLSPPLATPIQLPVVSDSGSDSDSDSFTDSDILEGSADEDEEDEEENSDSVKLTANQATWKEFTGTVKQTKFTYFNKTGNDKFIQYVLNIVKKDNDCEERFKLFGISYTENKKQVFKVDYPFTLKAAWTLHEVLSNLKRIIEAFVDKFHPNKPDFSKILLKFWKTITEIQRQEAKFTSPDTFRDIIELYIQQIFTPLLLKVSLKPGDSTAKDKLLYEEVTSIHNKAWIGKAESESESESESEKSNIVQPQRSPGVDEKENVLDGSLELPKTKENKTLTNDSDTNAKLTTPRTSLTSLEPNLQKEPIRN